MRRRRRGPPTSTAPSARLRRRRLPHCRRRPTLYRLLATAAPPRSLHKTRRAPHLPRRRKLRGPATAPRGPDARGPPSALRLLRIALRAERGRARRRRRRLGARPEWLPKKCRRQSSDKRPTPKPSGSPACPRARRRSTRGGVSLGTKRGRPVQQEATSLRHERSDRTIPLQRIGRRRGPSGRAWRRGGRLRGGTRFGAYKRLKI
mmetsp:Transcript_12303/g.41018  ORF Transcript_12303/g.41018 Transcript_12303/m.41018 type:complete len:205 (-) Transcript_12303:1505-2119(-)